MLNTCSIAGLAVPEEAAVLGVDNNELLCRICSPRPSSVIPNAQSGGFRAAEMLTQLMNGDSRLSPINGSNGWVLRFDNQQMQ